MISRFKTLPPSQNVINSASVFNTIVRKELKYEVLTASLICKTKMNKQ